MTSRPAWCEKAQKMGQNSPKGFDVSFSAVGII